MRRTIEISEIEAAPLWLRWPSGLDLAIDLTIQERGEPVDASLINPVLVLEPRSSGPGITYPGQIDYSAIGTATFLVPGAEYRDPNGYRLSMFGTLGGINHMIARGVAVTTPSPTAQPSDGVVPSPRQDFFNLEIIRNDSYTWQFTMWGDTAKTIPSDLTGAVVTAQVRSTPGGAILANMPCEIKDAAAGIVWMSIASEQTGGLPASAYWDMQIAYPDGSIRTPVQGRVIVTEDVTRP